MPDGYLWWIVGALGVGAVAAMGPRVAPWAMMAVRFLSRLFFKV